MGLFSSKYKTYAYASSTPLVEKKYYVDTTKKFVLDAVLTNDTVINGIKAAYVYGLPRKAKQMIRYARKSYIHELPTNNFLGFYFDKVAVENYIHANVQPNAIVIDAYLGPTRQDFYNRLKIKQRYKTFLTEVQAKLDAGQTIQMVQWKWKCYYVDLGDNGGYQDCDWRTETSPVTSLKQLPSHWNEAAVTNMAPYIGSGWKNANYIYYGVAEWDGRKYGRNHSSTDFDGNTTTKWITYYTAPVAPAGDHETKTNIYLQVVYEFTNADGETEYGYFYYRQGSNTHPEMEFSLDKDSVNEFMPIGLLRVDKVNYNKDPDSKKAISTDKLLDKIEIDGEKLIEEIHKQVTSDKYEDQDGKEQKGGGLKDDQFWDMFVHFGVPIVTTYPASQEYMYRFFNFLQGHSLYSASMMQAIIRKWVITNLDAEDTGWCDDGGCYGYSPSRVFSTNQHSKITITEGGRAGYNAEFRWLFIQKKKAKGDLGISRGAYRTRTFLTGSTASLNELKKFVDTKTASDLNRVVYRKYGSLRDTTKVGFLIADKQQKDGTYESLLVYGLEQGYTINTGHGDKGVVFNLADSETKSQFYFPISIGIYRQMSHRREEELLYNSLRCDIFVVQTIKIRWYQRGFFKFLFIIIAVVLVIYLGPYAGMGLQAALNAGGAVLLKFIAANLVLSMYISFVAGNVLGGKIGMIFALMMSIMMPIAIAGGTSQAVTAAFRGMFNSPLAFLQTVGKIAQIGMQFYQESVLKDMQYEMKMLGASYKERQEELQAAYDQLYSPNDLSPWTIMGQPAVIYPEGMEEFLARNLNPNPGVMSLDTIENFVDLCLKLPDKPGEPNFLEVVVEGMQQNGDRDGYF